MRIDWDKDTGEWRVFDEAGTPLDKARHIVIQGTCELITDGQKHHGWLISAGKLERRSDTLFIR